ncbi:MULTISPECIES: DUF3558 domain-containing protein [Actinokineospora]|uniref:DUF3558 domain-containing protein n=1 Tax=Actinokineospora TaxID=39845 RepID=UPI00167186EE|nr:MULTISPECIES: DUF3558 domain-containing protein [Actinokineospora]
MRTSPLVASLATALLVVGACATTTAGQPESAGPASRTQAEPTRGTTTEPAQETPLAAVEPCDLLTAAGQSAMAVTGEGQSRKVGSARYCEWRVRKGSVRDSYTISVGVWEGLSIDGAVSERPVRPLRVNSRAAVEGIGVQGGSCFVALAVTDSSRVDAAVVGDDGEKLCPLALELAELVEPELP